MARATIGITGATCCHIICRPCDCRSPRDERNTDFPVRAPSGVLTRGDWPEEQRRKFAGLTGHVGLCSSSKNFYEKIGILFGQENCFPRAFIDRVNQKTGGKEIVAEVRQDRQSDSGRAVRLRRDHRSHFAGRPVLSRLARRMQPSPAPPWSTIRFGGAPTRNFSTTRSRQRSASRFHAPCCCRRMKSPPDTNDELVPQSRPIRSIGKEIFNYVGWPAFFKPFAGGGWKTFIACTIPEEFYPRLQRDRPARHDVAGRSEIRDITSGVIRSINAMSASCPTIRGIRIICDIKPSGKRRRRFCRMSSAACLQLNQYLGYDLNTVEFADARWRAGGDRFL